MSMRRSWPLLLLLVLLLFAGFAVSIRFSPVGGGHDETFHSSTSTHSRNLEYWDGPTSRMEAEESSGGGAKPGVGKPVAFEPAPGSGRGTEPSLWSRWWYTIFGPPAVDGDKQPGLQPSVDTSGNGSTEESTSYPPADQSGDGDDYGYGSALSMDQSALEPPPEKQCTCPASWR
jgi:hypothetical protein